MGRAHTTFPAIEACGQRRKPTWNLVAGIDLRVYCFCR